MRYKDLINENKPGSIAHQINWGGKNKTTTPTQQPKKSKGLLKKAINSVQNIFSDKQYNEMTAGAVASVAQPMPKKRKKTNEVAPVSDTQKSLNNLNKAKQQAASGDTVGAMNSIAKADTGSVMYNALNKASREFGKAGMTGASNEIKKVLPAMQAASDETRAIKTGSAFDPRRQRTESATAGPDKCWPGYAPGAKTGVKTKAGTGKNKGKRVNNCEKK